MWPFTKKPKQSELDAIKIAELKKKQLELGNKALEILRGAAASNKVYNIMKGAIEPGIQPLKILRMEDNGGRYTIIVECKAAHLNRSVTVLQLDIMMDSNRIHALYGDYGPEENKTIEEFDYFISNLRDYVQGWRFYKD